MDPPSHQEVDGYPTVHFRAARWPEDLDTVRELFQDYRRWLADHQDPAPPSEARVRSGLALVDQLIAGLPGMYRPPRGEILLWFEDESLVACGAMRELEPKVAEIKRIFVRADYRGGSFGNPWVRGVLGEARRIGYERLRADTLPSMTAAIEFYQECGFLPVPAFWPHPVANALFFERAIGD